MKSIVKNILFALAAILTAVSCVKEQTESLPEYIMIQATALQTKAMLEPGEQQDGTLFTPGNRLQIYDFVDNSNTPHINDQIGPDVEGNTHGFAGVWPFEDGPHEWEEGSHKFFGWLHTDANFTPRLQASDFFTEGFSFDPATKILSINAKSMKADTPQFDFMYSNIIITEPQSDPVRLEFSHIFTAVSFGAVNGSESKVTIKEFRIENILNKKSATIDFSGSSPVVTYTEATKDQYLTISTTSPYTIKSEDEISNIFDGSMNQEFLMLWPLTSDQIHSDSEINVGEDENVEYDDYPTDYRMYIKYSFDDSDQEFEKRLNFPDIDLVAGKKYHFDISFLDKTIGLKTIVKDWVHDTQTIDYTNEVVSVGAPLVWDETKSTLMESESGEKLVVIKNGQPAEASFTFDAPLGGVWLISPSGDIDAFRITPDSGEINNSTAHIRVVPLIDDPKREYKITLKFAVRRPDGRIIAADELVQPANTKRSIVLSPM